jgi:glycosyltransferase involved in cell wall biosynthesis
MIVYCAELVGLCGMGGGIVSQLEIDALSATGHPLTVICAQKDPNLGASGCVLSERPIEWIVISDYRTPHPPELSRAYLQSQWRLIQLTRRIRGLKPDLLVVQAPAAHRRIEGYRSWVGIRRVMALQGSPDQFTGVYHDGVNKLHRVVSEICSYDAVVQAGEIMAASWASQPGLETLPSLVVNNTIHEPDVAPIVDLDPVVLRAEREISSGTFALVCMASLQFRKGQDLLLEAMNALMPRYAHLHLYLVGPPVMGWGGREILRAVESHPFRERIHVVGLVPPAQALRWIKTCDCFVLPSREEAMPLSVLEAMYLGTPVVASDVNGIPNEIEDNVSGLLFSHSHPEGLQKAIARMIEDRPFRMACVQAARHKYDEEFNQQLYLRRWKEIVAQYV